MIGSSTMTDATSRNEALEALKAFNTAITTTRLYPADAPQVPNAVEKAYQAVKHHLRKNGDLNFSIENDEFMLCGRPIQKQTLGKLHGADVFQHLKLLGLNCTVIRPGIDRKTFKQILSFFTSAPQKIKKDGGGMAYAGLLGISDVFPANYSHVQVQDDSEKMLLSLSSSVPDMKDEWVDYLLGKHHSQTSGREVLDIFRDPDLAARIITTSIARALQEIRKQEVVDLSPAFEQVLGNVEELLNQVQKRDVALKTAVLLLQGLKGAVLGVLFSQSFPGIFGEALSAGLISRISNDDFRGIIEYLQKREKESAEKFGHDSSQFHMIRNTMSRLLNTKRGKQFQALEKARLIIEAGEKERRNKRIQTGLNAIIQGNTSILHNDEIVLHLPHTVERLLANGKDDVAALLIEKLTVELLKGDDKVQLRLSQSLGRIGEILVSARKWDWLEKLAGPLLAWVKDVDGGDAVFEKIITVLQQVMLHGLRVGNYKKADQILDVFFKIRSGVIQKPSPLRALTGRVQDQFIDRTLLPLLLSQCLADPSDEALGQRLSAQGPIAARFLITTLLSSKNAGERIKILDLLTNMGPLLPPVIVEQLSEPMPWFGKRNLLKLLSETGSEEHVAAVFDYLDHDDLRVQREAFVCVYKISGNNRKKALLQALPLAGETMKIQVVKALVSLVDDEVSMELADLLMDQEHFSPDIRGPLVQQICRTLSYSSSKTAVEVLEKFIAQRRKSSARKLDLEVWRSAEKALQQIEVNQQKKRQPLPPAQLQPPEQTIELLPTGEGKRTEFITDFPEEQQVRELLEQRNKGQAKAFLVDLIEQTARLKQFDQAEKLREWLIQIDPMALRDIIRTAEIIENEKTSSIEKDHMETWFALYDVLTTEEFNTLYHTLEHKKYASEEIIVKQGAMQSCLYFINSGRVKLCYTDNDTEVLVKIMGRGEVIGAKSFFDASVWTIDVVALGYAELSVLPLENTKNWHKDYPALESKLQDFCMKFEGLQDYFLKTGRDRRGDERISITGRVTTILLDRYGKDTGISSKGDLTDISAGGVSFFIHISQKKNARLLLGRTVRVVLPTESILSGKVFNTEGVIVAVRSHRVMHNEYSAHVSFDQPLSKNDLQGILKIKK
jgi:CRP-like cAMP-binding protein